MEDSTFFISTMDAMRMRIAVESSHSQSYLKNTEKSWNIISMDWFLRWRSYVNLTPDLDKLDIPETRSPEEMEALHPGRIDNTPLSHSATYPNVLRKELIEGQDFVALPNLIAAAMFRKFGLDGNYFKRKVINVGTLDSPEYQIDLYPVRVEAYLVENGHLTPEAPAPINSIFNRFDSIIDEKYFQRRYYHKAMLVADVLKELQANFKILPDDSVVRYWLYDPQGQEQKDILMSSSCSGRKLRWDMVCWDGPWRLLRNAFGPMQQLGEIIGKDDFFNYDSIKIMIESAKKSSGAVNWPRDEILSKWQMFLQPGDLLDFQRSIDQWYEAVVEDIMSDGDVFLQFLARDEDFFLVIEPLSPDFAPLHSHTPNRAEWRVGQEVEVKLEGVDDNKRYKWIEGCIREIQGDKVLVGYEPPRSPCDGMDDNLPTSKTTYLQWHDLYSDRIGSMFMHLKPKEPANPTSTSAALTNVPYSHAGSTLANDVKFVKESIEVVTEEMQASIECSSDPAAQVVSFTTSLEIQASNTSDGVLADLQLQLSAFAMELKQLKVLQSHSMEEADCAKLSVKIADTNAKILAIEAEVSIVHTRLMQGEQHTMDIRASSEWAMQQLDSFPSWVHELQLTPSHVDVLTKWEGLDFNAASLLADVECTAANVQTMVSEIEEMKANISKVKQQNADESERKFYDLLKHANSVQARGAILDPKFRDCVEQHYLRKNAVLLGVAEVIESKFNEHILVASLLKTKKFESTGGKVACALGLMSIVTDQLPFGSIVSSVAGIVASEMSGGRREERYGRLSALVDGSSTAAAAVLAQKIGRKIALSDQVTILSKAKKSSKDADNYAAILAGSCLEVVLRGAFDLTDIRSTAKSKGKDWIEEVIEAGIIRTNNILTNKKMFVLEQHELRQLAAEMDQHHLPHAPKVGGLENCADAIATMQVQMKQFEDIVQHLLKANQRLQHEIDGLKHEISGLKRIDK